MSIAPFRNLRVPHSTPDSFEPGDRMDRETFHAIYEQMSEDFNLDVLATGIASPEHAAFVQSLKR